MENNRDSSGQRRNRNFDETHRMLIEKAVELISRTGVEGLSVSAVARIAKMNRSTVYYHFDSRESLVAAVKAWSSQQLARGFDPGAGRRQRIDHITGFVLDNPEVIKLWIDDFIAPGDIRERYPHWDEMVAGVAVLLRASRPGEEPDAEVFCTLMLAAAFVAPRVFRNSVAPRESHERIVARFAREQQRWLAQAGLGEGWGTAPALA